MTDLPHVQSSEQDGVTVVAPIGEFDISTVDMLREIFVDVVTPTTNRMVLDLARTEFVDSLAIGAMLGVGRRANEWGGWVRLVAPTPPVRKVLALTGLDKVFGMYDTVDQAIAHQVSDGDGATELV